MRKERESISRPLAHTHKHAPQRTQANSRVAITEMMSKAVNEKINLGNDTHANTHTHTYLSVSPVEPLRFHRLTRLDERLAAEEDFPSPTCMRTTVLVVKALRTLRSGLAKMM